MTTNFALSVGNICVTVQMYLLLFDNTKCSVFIALKCISQVTFFVSNKFTGICLTK